MKTKTLKIWCAVLLVSTLLLAWGYISEKVENNSLQTNIDNNFTSNLSSLYSYLFGTGMANEDMTIDAHVKAGCCKSLFAISSYTDNAALQDIMLSMAEMLPPNARIKMITDREVIDKIGYLLGRVDEPDAEELANEIWDKLSNELQEQK